MQKIFSSSFSIASEKDEIDKTAFRDGSNSILSDNDCIAFFDAEQILSTQTWWCKKIIFKNMGLIQNLISLMVTRKDISKF